MPSIVLITGPPGSGKSTLADVAASILSAPVLAWDWIMAALSRVGERDEVVDVVVPSQCEVGRDPEPGRGDGALAATRTTAFWGTSPWPAPAQLPQNKRALVLERRLVARTLRAGRSRGRTA